MKIYRSKRFFLSLISVSLLNPDLIEKISVVAIRDQQLEPDTSDIFLLNSSVSEDGKLGILFLLVKITR